MKFTIKNRPILLDTRKSVEETLDWFEGFEKELREVIEGLKIGAVEFDHGAIWAIKEILGE